MLQGLHYGMLDWASVHAIVISHFLVRGRNVLAGDYMPDMENRSKHTPESAMFAESDVGIQTKTAKPIISSIGCIPVCNSIFPVTGVINNMDVRP